MRILIANDGIDDVGGVDSYLRAIVGPLRAREHEVAFLHVNGRRQDSRPPAEPAFGIRDEGLESAMERGAAWRPDVCFSHNMQPLDVEEALLGRWRVVKMMHGYFGTCIGGQKAHLFPSKVPCGKTFGPACLARFLPRGCGQRNIVTMTRQYRWAQRQRALFDRYAAIVVASQHMRDEYEAHGVPASRVWSVPLFAPAIDEAQAKSAAVARFDVLFLGRMTNLKGGDLLVRAVASASRTLGTPVTLVMAGDGPARSAWQALASAEGVRATFVGWVDAPGRADLLRRASMLAIPSIWPEPFGLVGLEAAAAGVPSIAFDVGGIREWLRDNANGILLRGRPTVPALGDAIASLCRDSALRDRLAGGALNAAREMTVERHVDALVTRVFRSIA
jgi:glycosyltransferase involved in cell wall biosynthesis